MNEVPPFTVEAFRPESPVGDRQFDDYPHHNERAGPPPLKLVCPTQYAGLLIPDREWLVANWIPVGVVTGLYGDGGLGKSLIAQTLQTAAALVLPWLGLPVKQAPSLGIYCEDSADELQRRQDSINQSYGCDFGELADVHWLARLGDDNLLMTFGRNGVGEVTAFQKQVVEASLDLGVKLLVVDTAADVFGGDENNRSHVRQFVSRGLGSIAQKIDGAVLLCAHPSRSGISSGQGDGGSTGWSNSLRSRLFLSAPSVEDDGIPDSDARVLTRKKANYAARNDEVRLRWRSGVIGPDEPSQIGLAAFGRRTAEDVFLALLDEFAANDRAVSDSAHAGNYAARVFSILSVQQRENYRKVDFQRSMESLFASKKIRLVDYGRKSDMRKKIVRGEQ